MARSKNQTKSRGAPSPQYDFTVSTRETMEAVRHMRLYVTIAGIALPLLFGWLKFREVNFGVTLLSIPADLVFRSAMAIYFASWIAGLLSDLSDQEFVLVHAPASVQVKIGGGVIGAAITLAFAVLCLVSAPTHFSLALLVFNLLGIASWLYLVRVVLPHAIEQSESFFRDNSNYLGLEKLRLVFDRYLSGSWQWYRFTAGFILVAAIAYFAFQRELLEDRFRIFQEHSDILSSYLFLGYVLILEGWIWFKRLQVKGGIAMLTEFERSYELNKRSP